MLNSTVVKLVKSMDIDYQAFCDSIAVQAELIGADYKSSNTTVQKVVNTWTKAEVLTQAVKNFKKASTQEAAIKFMNSCDAMAYSNYKTTIGLANYYLNVYS